MTTTLAVTLFHLHSFYSLLSPMDIYFLGNSWGGGGGGGIPLLISIRLLIFTATD